MYQAIPVLVLLLSLAGVAVVLFRQLLKRPPFENLDPDWLENYSVARYRPLERLLSDEDFRFLTAQPGYRPEIARRLRAERRSIFRAYLANLVSDFNRLHAYAKAAVVSASSDEPQLAASLIRLQVTFYFAIGAVHCRLALHALGIGHVPVSELLRSVDLMRTQALEWNQAGAAA